MYASHQATIAAWGSKSPEHTFHVMKFVIATAHRRFYTVPTVLETGKGLYPMQERALSALWEQRQSVYANIYVNRDDPLALMQYVTTLPGLGMVKAGFVCQLLAGSVGCIDTHNMKAFAGLLGVKPAKLSKPGKQAHSSMPTMFRLDCSPLVRIQRIGQYVDVCHKAGGSEYLWDNWCAILASRHTVGSIQYPWQTAEQVSQFHVDTCIR